VLDDALVAQLVTLMGNLRRDIDLVVTLDDSDASKRLKELVDQVAGASTRIHVREAEAEDGIRVPSFAIVPSDPAAAAGSGVVRFAGLPMGHEFSSLVLALLHVGGHPPKEDAALLDRVRSLKGPLNFETYFSVTCQNCPTVVQALNTMAALNPNVSHTAIEGGAFPKETEERGVLSVPTIYLNGEFFDTGRIGLEEFVNRLDVAGESAAAEELSARDPYDVLIVGGGPAGLTAAIYTARKGVRTGVIADRIGGQVLDTAGIDNFPSVAHTEGTVFGASLGEHARSYGVELITGQLVESLNPPAAADGKTPIEVKLVSGATLRARTLIIATGAKWRNVGVPGEAEYRTKGVTYCPHCDGPLFAGKPVAVIGGGNSGIEAAVDLAGVASHVTVVEFLDQLKADQVLLDKLQSLPNTTVIKNAATTEIVGDGTKVTGLRYSDRATDESHQIEVAGVFVQIGLVPSTSWLRDGPVDLTQRGEIVVDARCQTNVPGIFAAGDCTTQPYKQIVISAGSGATAALAAFDYLMRS
jgi:alkyl hydroperoxide reductase subunit F